MTGLGLVRTMHAIAIDSARPQSRDVHVPHFVGVFGQLDAFEFVLARLVEQAQLDLRCIGGEEREIDAPAVPCRAERKRQALGNAGIDRHGVFLRRIERARRMLHARQQRCEQQSMYL
jgi:hypothetical protein